MAEMQEIGLPDGRIYVAGEWREGRGAEITSIYPADRSVNLTLRGASRDDVEEAIAGAQKAAEDPSWRNLLPHQRATYLHRIADGLTRHGERIAQVQSRDTGKTLAETRALAASAAGTFRYFAAVLETEEEALTPSRGNYITMSVHEPIGVVAGITPWNSPIASDAQKLAPALAAGNAVLMKPASWSPLVSLVMARICEEAGLPPGLLSVLPGRGEEVGDTLVTHPAIGKVSFTGGTEVGRGIARKAAEKLMPVSLELGGKSPTIVFADADLDLTIAGILFGIFSSTGQSCIAGSRLLVQRTIYESFVERLVSATKALRVGHPADPATQVAPMIRDPHRDSVERAVAQAVGEGGTILCGGRRPEGAEYDAGIYYLPTIIAGLPSAARTCQEEIFGPVLHVQPFEDEAEAIALSNESSYGLACGIWTRDFNRAWRIGRGVGTGTVWVNTYKQFSISTPFGGIKDSGLGREKGRQGLRAWQRQKSFYLDTSGQPHPWAGIAA
ncbi:aldehyde dehydrogenase [Roseomonas populi]|uniref:Aldehyde dehydrogenase n=1 Tax=Roseomonas populi TaxID=3121582 RepID=A0ABT1X3M2_9PROT|nr:aldehyde dehydrogenase [Roseomonas pecuniae]